MNDEKNSCTQHHQLAQGYFCGKNATLLRGLLATLLGFLLVAFAYQIILQVIFCLLGLILIDYGLRVLQVTIVISYIDNILTKLRNLHK